MSLFFLKIWIFLISSTCVFYWIEHSNCIGWSKWSENINSIFLITEPYAVHAYEKSFSMCQPVAAQTMNRKPSGEHCLQKMDGNKLKRCFYCQMAKIRTRAGYRVKTTSHCVVCDVPLCGGTAKCFELYHELLKSTDHYGGGSGYHGWIPKTPVTWHEWGVLVVYVHNNGNNNYGRFLNITVKLLLVSMLVNGLFSCSRCVLLNIFRLWYRTVYWMFTFVLEFIQVLVFWWIRLVGSALVCCESKRQIGTAMQRQINLWPVFSDPRQTAFPSMFPKPRRNPPYEVPHRLVTGSRKRCAMCYYSRVKTKSGWDIYTNYKCEACDVALCNREFTQCFKCFHDGIQLHYSFANADI